MIYVVGLGPGNEDQMTPRALAALEKCDIIIGYKAYIELVRHLFEGRKELVASPMKGEALPKRLSELEELFETERDQRRIDSMRRDVEKYEQLVRRRAALNEQARLKAQEAEQLKRDAAKLKNK